MKTDRELLELSAKAAGVELREWFDSADGFLTRTGIGERTWWNPIANDGDALRLAVKLGIGTIHHLGWGQVFQPSLENRLDFMYEGDQYAATRRAIVCAAAAIGG